MPRNSQARYHIETASSNFPTDEQLEGLLHAAYVESGFTDPLLAKSLFNAQSVRSRGSLIVARDIESHSLLGMLILVSADAPTKQLASRDEVELHLLAVDPAFRRQGIARALLFEAFRQAREADAQRVLLWTQKSMRAAQELYASLNFVRLTELDFKRHAQEFIVLARDL